jgi:colanic acid biosynthesis glycosyl transferase WcaI
VRILIWSPNYDPEPIGIPPLVTDAAEWLLARGHEVDVVTAVPNYPERRIAPEYRGVLWRSERQRGVDVHRSWLRVRREESILDKALYEATFAAFSLPRVVTRLARADVVLCVIPSLVAAMCAASLVRAAKVVRPSLRLVLWIQDLVVNAAVVLDDAARVSPLLGVARRGELASARAADSVIVCSPGFADYFSAAGVSGSRLVMIANWVDVEWIRPGPLRNGSHPVRFLYAGNVGYSQGFETLVRAAELAGGEVEVLISGDGNAYDRVRAMSQGVANITVRKPVPEREFPLLLASADVHVVLQRRAAAGANLPSKIGPYLASGRPILASLDPATPAADLLRSSRAAVIVPPENPEQLARAMTELASRPVLRASLARQGRRFAADRLDRRGALARLEAVVAG